MINWKLRFKMMIIFQFSVGVWLHQWVHSESIAFFWRRQAPPLPPPRSRKKMQVVLPPRVKWRQSCEERHEKQSNKDQQYSPLCGLFICSLFANTFQVIPRKRKSNILFTILQILQTRRTLTQFQVFASASATHDTFIVPKKERIKLQKKKKKKNWNCNFQKGTKNVDNVVFQHSQPQRFRFGKKNAFFWSLLTLVASLLHSRLHV